MRFRRRAETVPAVLDETKTVTRRLEPCVAWDDGKLRPVWLIPDHLRAPYEEAAS